MHSQIDAICQLAIFNALVAGKNSSPERSPTLARPVVATWICTSLLKRIHLKLTSLTS